MDTHFDTSYYTDYYQGKWYKSRVVIKIFRMENFCFLEYPIKIHIPLSLLWSREKTSSNWFSILFLW